MNERPIPARRFGHVRVTAIIGQGAMGQVFKGWHEVLRQDVAVKVLSPEHSASTVQRFLRECRIAKQVRHPNVVHVIGSNEVGGQAFMVLEYVAGDDLGKHLEHVHPAGLPIARCLVIGADAAAGIAAIHACGIVHRDIKPDNILIDEQGRAKIADLGLCKCLLETDQEHLTQTGYVVGTPLYVSPECIRDPKAVTPASDVYGLGGTLYHMLCGRVPCDGPSIFAIMKAHLDIVPVPVRTHRPDAPAVVAELVERCLAKEPKARPTAAEVEGVLRASAGVKG